MAIHLFGHSSSRTRYMSAILGAKYIDNMIYVRSF